MTDQTLLPQWVGGFFDAEGNIYQRISQSKSSPINYNTSTKLSVGQAYTGGFFEGDGSINTIVQESSTDRLGYNISPRAEVCHSLGGQLLENLCEYADGLKVEYSIYTHENRYNDEWRPVFHWCVCNRSGVEKFLNSIRDYTITKRPQIDILVDEIIPLLRNEIHLNRRGFLKLVAWRDVMDSYKGGARGKYNLEYFENEWGMVLEPEQIPDRHPRKSNL